MLNSNTCVTYSYACRNIVNTIITNETQFFRKYSAHTLFEMVRKGYVRVIVWEVSWRLNKTAIYWPPALLVITALLSHPVGVLNRGPWGPSSLLGLILTASNCNHCLQTLISNSLELHVAPGYIIVRHPSASVCGTSALNSIRPQSRVSPDILDRMHLWFTQVFVQTQLNIKTVLFQTIQFNISTVSMSKISNNSF